MSRAYRKPRGNKGTYVVCPTGKTGFTRGVAEQRLAEYSQGGNRHHAPKRIYECPHCGHWHLTTRTA